MTQHELIKEISDTVNITQKEGKEIMKTFVEEIISVLNNGDKYNQAGFGTFYTSIAHEHVGYNPFLRQKMLYPKKRRIKFRPSAILKKELNE